jgi:methionyl-tRNA synthetase
VQRSFDAGDIYEGTYEGWYCVSCEAFKQEKDLVDGLVPIHQTRPDWIKERTTSSRCRSTAIGCSRTTPRIPSSSSRSPPQRDAAPARGGLEDISVSRAGQAWGIPLPFDPASVVYVWYDALINYLAPSGYGTTIRLFERWWPADLHLVGKDITRFHCVVWPAMLMSAGSRLPRQVFGHGWVLTKGEKMSKSLGTVVDPLDAADRLGPDPLRLYLTQGDRLRPDGDFTWESVRGELQRRPRQQPRQPREPVTSMAHRYRGGARAVRASALRRSRRRA